MLVPNLIVINYLNPHRGRMHLQWHSCSDEPRRRASDGDGVRASVTYPGAGRGDARRRGRRSSAGHAREVVRRRSEHGVHVSPCQQRVAGQDNASVESRESRRVYKCKQSNCYPPNEPYLPPTGHVGAHGRRRASLQIVGHQSTNSLEGERDA
jgi:hypothetical protein